LNRAFKDRRRMQLRRYLSNAATFGPREKFQQAMRYRRTIRFIFASRASSLLPTALWRRTPALNDFVRTSMIA
jgi:hypothetical protein